MLPSETNIIHISQSFYMTPLSPSSFPDHRGLNLHSVRDLRTLSPQCHLLQITHINYLSQHFNNISSISTQTTYISDSNPHPKMPYGFPSCCKLHISSLSTQTTYISHSNPHPKMPIGLPIMLQVTHIFHFNSDYLYFTFQSTPQNAIWLPIMLQVTYLFHFNSDYLYSTFQSTPQNVNWASHHVASYTSLLFPLRLPIFHIPIHTPKCQLDFASCCKLHIYIYICFACVLQDERLHLVFKVGRHCSPQTSVQLVPTFVNCIWIF